MERTKSDDAKTSVIKTTQKSEAEKALLIQQFLLDLNAGPGYNQASNRLNTA